MRAAAGVREGAGMRNVFPSSFIRTMTVGSGLGPDLLTLPAEPASARGLGAVQHPTAGGDFRPALKTHRPGRRHRQW